MTLEERIAALEAKTVPVATGPGLLARLLAKLPEGLTLWRVVQVVVVILGTLAVKKGYISPDQLQDIATAAQQAATDSKANAEKLRTVDLKTDDVILRQAHSVKQANEVQKVAEATAAKVDAVKDAAMDAKMTAAKTAEKVDSNHKEAVELIEQVHKANVDAVKEVDKAAAERAAALQKAQAEQAETLKREIAKPRPLIPLPAKE